MDFSAKYRYFWLRLAVQLRKVKGNLTFTVESVGRICRPMTLHNSGMEKTMKTRMMIASLVALAVFATSYAVESTSLEGVKCLINPKAGAKAEQAAEWKEGKVFFCCGNCKGKFEKASKEEKEKMAAKANAQLVASKQYEQKACPLSGGQLNAATAIEVGGSKVAFCCNNCKGKVEKMSDEDKLAGVFGEKAFKTANFTKVEAKK